MPRAERSSEPASILTSGDFLGRLERRIEIGCIKVSQWTTNGPEARGVHGHEDAHFMFVTTGDYVTDAEGPEGPFASALVFSPPGMLHDDRLVAGAGSFFAVSIESGLARGGRRFAPIRRSRRLATVRPQITARRITAALRADRCADIEDGCLELLAAATEEDGEAAPSPWLARAREALSDPFAPTPSIQALGAQVGVHPTYLARSFARLYGCTPGEYSRSIRLSAAAQLITRGQDPIGDIALRCGFADQSHLTNQLRRAYGMSPGALRRRTLAPA